jgi:hypothetical protein
MARTPKGKMFLSLGVVFAILPFLLGLMRLRTANDPRLIWMALAGFLGALAAIALTERTQSDTLMLISARPFIAATVFAAIAAYLLGARAAAGVWGMATVLGFLFMCSVTFINLSRAGFSQGRP